MTKADWTNHQDLWVTQTPVGRYVIRRAKKGSREFRLWFNKAPTKYHGTVEELQKIVDQILFTLTEKK